MKTTVIKGRSVGRSTYITVADDDDKLIKTSEAARQLGCHTNTVLNLLQQKVLTGVRLGTRTIKVHQSSVTALLSNKAYSDVS